MNLNKKLIIGNTLLLIIFTILIFKVEKNIIIWLCFYFLGCSLFALILKDTDKNKRQHKTLLKTSEDDGIFEYTETGFYIWNNDFITLVEWNDILRIIVHKIVHLEDIHTELLIETLWNNIALNDSMHGWEKFIAQLRENLPIHEESSASNTSDVRTSVPVIIYQKQNFR